VIENILSAIQSSDILIGVSFILIMLLTAQCAQLIKRVDSLTAKLDLSHKKQIKALKVVNQGAIGVGKRLLKIDKKLNVVLLQQSQLEMKDPENLNYQHALSMMQTGLDPQNVMKTCGLAQGEVELIQSLTSKRKQKDIEEKLNKAIN